VPDDVLDLLAHYQQQGHEVWLELGLQSADDKTLAQVNRGHGFAEYKQAVVRARRRGIKVCTHLILGLPGETTKHHIASLEKVLALGVDGLKFHPLHVVKGTQLANQWRRGDYKPMTMGAYVSDVAALIARTPADVIFHRLTGTAPANILLAPEWCAGKWQVLNRLAAVLAAQAQLPGMHAGQGPDVLTVNAH
jgi:hypothetical protein